MAFSIDLISHKGAFLHLSISINMVLTPSSNETFVFQFNWVVIFFILAKVVSGSPGLLGIYCTSQFNNSTSLLMVEVSAPRLNLSSIFVSAATKASATSVTYIKSLDCSPSPTTVKGLFSSFV